jgi:nitrile hydratase accessory protein
MTVRDLQASGVIDAGSAEPSLPRANGAPVFDAPWQARAWAMAVLVVERSGHPWEAFRQRLIAAIGEQSDRPYWESWVIALDRFIADTGLLR